MKYFLILAVIVFSLGVYIQTAPDPQEKALSQEGKTSGEKPAIGTPEQAP